MTEPESPRPGGSAGDSWEQRTAGLASEIQRWLIRSSARSMRDELGGQVRKALRGREPERGDTWATATTEPPDAADEAPECAWCPVCRAARRISQAKSGADARGGPKLADAADVMAAAVKDALAGLDTILSHRPPAGSGRPGESRDAPRDHGRRSAGQPQPAGEPLRKEATGNGPGGGTGSGEARPGEARPGEARPGEARPGEARPDRTEDPEDEPGHRG